MAKAKTRPPAAGVAATLGEANFCIVKGAVAAALGDRKSALKLLLEAMRQLSLAIKRLGAK